MNFFLQFDFNYFQEVIFPFNLSSEIEGGNPPPDNNYDFQDGTNYDFEDSTNYDFN